MPQPHSGPRANSIKPKRSRNGCRECRRLHRKCDENLPSCDYCEMVGKTCSYIKPLSWGGRPFRKSEFGQSIVRGEITVEVQECASSPDDDEVSTSFVYGTAPQKRFRSSKAASAQSTTPADSTVDSLSEPSILDSPDLLPWLSTTHRVLLHHFIQTTSRCFSLHAKMHSSLCSVLVPMALEKSHGLSLLSALVYAAGRHRSTLGFIQNDAALELLKNRSVNSLKSLKSIDDPIMTEVAAATAMVICLSEIIGGGEKPNSWRLHLQGAGAILEELDKIQREKNGTDSSSKEIIQRWHDSLRRLTSFSMQSSQTILENPSKTAATSCYIDDFNGFSTTLFSVIGEIDLLIQERNLLNRLATSLSQPSLEYEQLLFLFESRCRQMIQKVKSMMANPTGNLHPSVETSEEEKFEIDFMLLDEAYHHVALLQLYQRTLGLDSRGIDTQESVKRAIECMEQIQTYDRPCPAVALLQPLFTVGCETYEQKHRAFIIASLDKMKTFYAMGNVEHAKQFLLDLWDYRDGLTDGAVFLQWDQFIEQKKWDLTLY